MLFLYFELNLLFLKFCIMFSFAHLQRVLCVDPSVIVYEVEANRLVPFMTPPPPLIWLINIFKALSDHLGRWGGPSVGGDSRVG
jgi:hypothetical protein